MKLKNLNTKFLGRNNIYYEQIDSTQNEVWKQYEKDAPNGTLIMAGIQTSGIGTHGRVWHTDEANNIAFSFFIKMDCNINKLEGITIKIAEIIVELLKRKYRIILDIKEPNDIVFNNKKIGGILTQTKVICENVKCLAIGIGINTNKEKFSEDIINTATSIKKEFNVDVNIVEFIEEFCNIFEKEIIERIDN